MFNIIEYNLWSSSMANMGNIQHTMTPKVSICMPNYNFARYLPDAIESVLKQSYTDFEFIIVDNCSTDDSAKIVRRYAGKDARIRLTTNDRNVGPVNNLNLCLQKVRAEYVKFLFSDDMLATDNALERMVSVLDDHQQVALVASARNVIDSCSNVIQKWSQYKGMIGYPGCKIIQDCLIEQKNKIGEPTAVLFRKRHAERGFDVRYRQAVDLEMWFHILEQGDFAYIDEPLCSFRQHDKQQTHMNTNELNMSLINEPFLLLQDYADKPYVQLSKLTREYMKYVPAYGIWKLYKKKKISKREAIEKIKEYYNIAKFVLFYPFFKVCKFTKRSIESMRGGKTKRAANRACATVL